MRKFSLKRSFIRLFCGRILDKKLITAVKEADKTEILRLLEKGANPNSIDSVGQTLLYIAFELNSNLQKDIIEILLKNGADPNLAYKNKSRKIGMLSIVISVSDLDGNRYQNCLSTIETLFEYGADPRKDQASLIIASGIKRSEMLKLLIKHNAAINKIYQGEIIHHNLLYKNNITAIEMAELNKCGINYRILVQNGAIIK